MQVRFWGTRGSLPVSPKAATVRDKVTAALLAADGRRFADAAAVHAFIDSELDFAAAHTYGGATSCVEIDVGEGAFIVCDMGSGLRELGLDTLRRCAQDGHAREGAWVAELTDHVALDAWPEGSRLICRRERPQAHHQ